MAYDKVSVQLLYFPECPNIPAAREQLRRAFEKLNLTPNWTEIDVSAEGAPQHMQGYGSPSILVNGRDVAGASPGEGSSCRVYPGSEIQGVPALDAIVTALSTASAQRPSP